MKQYLIAVDLEGVHGVVGERFDKLLSGHTDYAEAVEAATHEINAAVRALYDCGAGLVAVWDNHGGGGNLDFSKIDPRVTKIEARGEKYRFDFVKNFDFSAILFIGYHAMEGTPDAVLAHTFSSTNIQYVKLDGTPVGELAIDTYICDGYGIKPIFIASDDVCIREMLGIREDISAVVTKEGRGRNRAVLRERSEVLADVYDGVRRAVELGGGYAFPFPAGGAELEVRYTRAETAEDIYAATLARGEIPVSYGCDTHTLVFRVSRANQIPTVL